MVEREDWPDVLAGVGLVVLVDDFELGNFWDFYGNCGMRHMDRQLGWGSSLGS